MQLDRSCRLIEPESSSSSSSPVVNEFVIWENGRDPSLWTVSRGSVASSRNARVEAAWNLRYAATYPFDNFSSDFCNPPINHAANRVSAILIAWLLPKYVARLWNGRLKGGRDVIVFEVSKFWDSFSLWYSLSLRYLSLSYNVRSRYEGENYHAFRLLIWSTWINFKKIYELTARKCNSNFREFSSSICFTVEEESLSVPRKIVRTHEIACV